MGLFDNHNKDVFGGVFDFNGDGKTTLDEVFIASKFFEKTTKEDNETDDISFDNDLDFSSNASENNEWQDFCDDSEELGISPEDYETEDEYNEALEEAEYAWNNGCDDGYDENIGKVWLGSNVVNIPISFIVECPALDELEKIREADFPNKRRYNAAYTLASEFDIYSDDEYEQSEKKRCQFIIEKADTVIAANYLTHDGDFLYCQAVKDKFNLPITLPDEDETREFGFSEMLQKIAKKDTTLCLEVWEWCLEQFLPYAGHDILSKEELTNVSIDYLSDFSNEFMVVLIKYMSEHPDFRTTVVAEAGDLANNLSELVVEAIKQNLPDTAKALFKDGLTIANGEWKQINELTDRVILFSKDYEELETIEYVEQELLPLIKTYQDEMILDEIEVWEKDIAKYKLDVEQSCDKYAYTRSNAWRQTVSDGKEYDLDPLDYDNEKEYLESLAEEKYRWRQSFKNRETCDLNPEDYETENDFLEVLSTKADEKRKIEREERHKKDLERVNVPTISDDKDIYIYCGVVLPFSSRPYSFRTNDTTIKIGDTVIIPIGEERKETEGKIVSVGQYTRIGVPYPVERTKFILRKVEDNISNG
ncbi:hypothetical protein RBG61_13050 [Paludicola sp. MB14-C6]|uniref:hypothetical protein n=1 Tax=Paludihabitans sp. MB14-C6 TaxID=3070656 RepID=UPI0027DAC0ED|nr:hypothetical protein [Paludicola sp. MB14-C6]WMJ22901.1 hypothetical protein RBG61_13050 [Paludicola sp. MB14-C6]